ncbi:D-alanyl-D-alanine carboxypeptidase [Erythrobacter pelagi]|uniref:serine-type D-Ala-D-Ala carboxypeptidase n=1 Tax=Qipengyuania pelagi TaxID=994320 RepID=A0A844Y6E0_9SPHN|nr:D-alanyl-D-alanine carboxypeptidase [Qipengyuania pelagi]
MRLRLKFLSLGLGGALAATSAGHAAPAVDARIPTPYEAPIAMLVDLSSGQTLFAREEDRRFMPASITKVMTTMVAFEWMERGKLFPQQVMTVRPDTFRAWNRKGSTMYLPHDARITVDELLHGITTVSANDASVVLAEGAAGSVARWAAAMNDTAARLGMADSHFNTPNGWMDDGQTFVTARDLVTLGSAMIRRHPSKYHHFVGKKGLEYNGIRQNNHDPIRGVVPGADGIKTGFTNQAGYGFLGSAERNGRRLVMVVAASPRGRERNDAARALIEWGFSNFDSRRLFETNERIATAKVQDGGVSEIGLVSHRPVRLSVPHGRMPKVDLAVRYEGPLRAPIADDEEVARLIVTVDGEQVNTLPLYAERPVTEATVIQRVFNGLWGWAG